MLAGVVLGDRKWDLGEHIKQHRSAKYSSNFTPEQKDMANHFCWWQRKPDGFNLTLLCEAWRTVTIAQRNTGDHDMMYLLHIFLLPNIISVFTDFAWAGVLLSCLSFSQIFPSCPRTALNSTTLGVAAMEKRQSPSGSLSSHSLAEVWL